MVKKKRSLLYVSAFFILLYTLLAIGFFAVANPQLKYKDAGSSIKSVSNNTITGEMVKGTSVEQTFLAEGDVIDGFSLMFGTFNRTNIGSINITISDDKTKHLLFKKQFDISKILDNEFHQIDIREPISIIKGKIIRISITPNKYIDGNAITLWYNNLNSDSNQKLFINGHAVKGTLCFNVSEKIRVPFEKEYIFSVLAFGIISLSYLIYVLKCKEKGKECLGLDFVNVIIKYRFLLSQLVSRDFKTKYRRSFFGILWSVLNPLLMMIVVSSVFSYVFRFNINNFPVYLILGQIFFNVLSESTTVAMGSIIGSGNLIKKVYIPKYIFPLEKVIFSFVNFFISFLAVGIVMIIYKIHIYSTIVFLPLVLIYLFMFCLGVGLLLSAISVFFRDTLHLYSVLLTAWSYLTPIFYPTDSLSESMKFFMNLNPMYHYIQYFRDIVLYGKVPTLQENFISLLISIIILFIGVVFFKKNQDRFILYI